MFCLIFLYLSCVYYSFCFPLTPSPVHYIKMSSPPQYRLQCKLGSCKYVSMLENRMSQQLVQQFIERNRSKGGRRIASFSNLNDKRSSKKSLRSSKVLRPNLVYTSNAKPAALEWRTLEVETSKIKRPSRMFQKKSLTPISSYNQQSRNLVQPQQSLFPSFERKMFRRNTSSSWLPSPSFVNGVPETIYHFRHPVRVRKLDSVNEREGRAESHEESHEPIERGIIKV